MPGAAGGPKQCLKPKSPGFTVMALMTSASPLLSLVVRLATEPAIPSDDLTLTEPQVTPGSTVLCPPLPETFHLALGESVTVTRKDFTPLSRDLAVSLLACVAFRSRRFVDLVRSKPTINFVPTLFASMARSESGDEDVYVRGGTDVKCVAPTPLHNILRAAGEEVVPKVSPVTLPRSGD